MSTDPKNTVVLYDTIPLNKKRYANKRLCLDVEPACPVRVIVLMWSGRGLLELRTRFLYIKLLLRIQFV